MDNFEDERSVVEVVGVVEATVAAVLDAEGVADASGMLEAVAEVSGREEVVEAVSAAAKWQWGCLVSLQSTDYSCRLNYKTARHAVC